MVDFLGSQAFHITFYVYEVDGPSKPLVILSITTTDTSKYKFRSLALSESESLGIVYPFTFGDILISELLFHWY